MTRFKRFRIWMIMAALSLAFVATPLLGVMLSRTNLDGIVSQGSHAQAAFERGSDAWLSAQSHVSHPHPQHLGPKYHWMVKGRTATCPPRRQGPATLPTTCPSRQERPAEAAAGGKEVKSG